MDILQMSISAAVLIIAIVILRAITLYRLPKKTFLALWGVVVCRLLIPFSIPSRFSFYTGVDMLKRALEKTAQSTVPTASGVLTVVPDMGMADIGETAGGASAVASSVSPFTVVWLVGMGVCAMFFIITFIKCKREFKTALPIQNDFISNWQQQHPLRLPVCIRQSDRIKAPLTYGVFRPVVLLPKTADLTNETALQYILTHEYVHIRRFDALTKLVLSAVVCIHWFNPLVWVMYVLVNRDIELSCDETVVKTFGEPIRSAYALTLIRLEERKGILSPLVSGFSKNAIEERITAIMKIKKNSVPIIVVAILITVGITTGFATSGAKADDNAGSQDNAEVLTDVSPSPDGAVSNDVTEDSGEVAAEISEDEAIVSENSWVWPVEGCNTVTTMFGKIVHPVTGTTDESDHICISGNNADGTNVYAALAGTVSDAGFDDEQGNYIVISHNDGIETSYRHLAETFVSTGDTVAAGDTIGTVGQTGTATGPCLGFCVYVDGVAKNPLNYYQQTSAYADDQTNGG